jgi:ribose transport system ATP-binding protein
MGEVAASRSMRYSWRDARRRTAEICARYGVDIDPAAPVDEIRPVQRAVLAILRAIEGIKASRGAGDEGDLPPSLLVLDEPTVFLPKQEVGTLFSLVRNIVATGSSVLFVSHDLDEVRQITDTVSVLRDGRSVGTLVTAESTKRDLVKLIVGHDLQPVAHTANRHGGGDVLVSVRGLRTSLVEEASFDVRRGEVLGLAGLVGSGSEDAVYALFGSGKAEGELAIDGTTIDLAQFDERQAVGLGLALVPADRKNDGSISDLPMEDNINVTVLDNYFTRGRLDHRALSANARGLIQEFDVRPQSPSMDYGFFSGGNQQKAMMAKWLQLSPKVLLLHEPTQGVDIGAREQIYSVIRSRTDTTTAIVASSDYEELATLCDRVGIFVKGRLLGFLEGDEITHAKIAELSMGSTADVQEAVGHDAAPEPLHIQQLSPSQGTE